MKLVALVSGGKDSIYALCNAINDGHDVVCLAHISSYDILKSYQKNESVDAVIGSSVELDSWMYQSIASEVVPLLSVALERNLYLKNRKDSETREELEDSDDFRLLKQFGDEVDFEIVQLYRLLKHVITEKPDIEGVVSGAILSTYQRVRIGLVCKALNLTSVEPLWQKGQSELLHEMVEYGMHAVLVKVASMGLKKEHIMKTIAEMEEELNRLQSKYGVYACGEGGEYESFTLDCPQYKNSIVPDEVEIVILDERDISFVGHARFIKCHLVSKRDSSIIPVSFAQLVESGRIVFVE